jgi:hypothetical protein
MAYSACSPVSKSAARATTFRSMALSPARVDKPAVFRLLFTTSIASLALVAPAVAMEETNPYILELLQRTEEKREVRRQENLQHYYDKNFSEYFDYTGRVSPELQSEIDAWKEKHLGR